MKKKHGTRSVDGPEVFTRTLLNCKKLETRNNEDRPWKFIGAACNRKQACNLFLNLKKFQHF